ncbi:GDP-mannose 4,6-dehydratase [Aurantivibrio plasticivorans]
MIKNKKTALITGVTGQDGAHLSKELLSRGWEVYGGYRRGSSSTTWRLDYLGIKNQVKLIECQLNEAQNIISVLQETRPDVIFHLASESFVADSFKYPGVTLDVNAHGTLNMLEGVRLVVPESKIFCASSSEIFGTALGDEKLSETSRFYPTNPYGISKLAAANFARLYRERYGVYSCSGILFNHEGPLRGRSFVTRKITYNIARLCVEGGEPFELGDLNSARDWGAAEDYVIAMCDMMDLTSPEDLIIASGRLTSIREFLKKAAESAGMSPVFEGTKEKEVCIDKNSGRVIAKVSERYFRPQDTPPLVGNTDRIMSLTDWEGSRSIDKLIGEMVEADLDRWKRGITNV